MVHEASDGEPVGTIDVGELLAAVGRDLMRAPGIAPDATLFFDYQGAVVPLPPEQAVLHPLLVALVTPWLDVPDAGSVFLLANVVPHRNGTATAVVQVALTRGRASREWVSDTLDSDLSPLDALPDPGASASADDALLAWGAHGGRFTVGDSPHEGRVLHAQITVAVAGPGADLASGAPHGLTAWLLGRPPIVFEAMTRRLHRLGWDVRRAASVAEARAWLRDGGAVPQLVLGYERYHVSAKDLAQLTPDVPADALHLLRRRPEPGAEPEAAGLDLPLSPRTLHDLTARALRRAGRTAGGPANAFEVLTRRPVALVADDNLVNQMLVTAMLNVLGFEVAVASDGQQAVDQCLRQAPSIVLMDLDMPVMDGFSAARAIRGHQADGTLPPFPIVPATAQPRTVESLRATAQAGMTGFIPKPLDMQVLHDEVVQALKAAA